MTSVGGGGVAGGQLTPHADAHELMASCKSKLVTKTLKIVTYKTLKTITNALKQLLT